MKEMGVKVGGQMVIRRLLAEVCVWSSIACIPCVLFTKPMYLRLTG